MILILLILLAMLSIIITEVNEQADNEMKLIYDHHGWLICTISFFIIPYFVLLLQIYNYVRYISSR
jgi:hypothetical protein